MKYDRLTPVWFRCGQTGWAIANGTAGNLLIPTPKETACP